MPIISCKETYREGNILLQDDCREVNGHIFFYFSAVGREMNEVIIAIGFPMYGGERAVGSIKVYK